MNQVMGTASPIGGGNSMQPFVVLLGTSLQFSGRMLRILRFEFPEVRFERMSDQDHLLEAVPTPSLIILHESVPDLTDRINGIRTALAGPMLAIACNDVAVFERVCRSDPQNRTSLLQLNTQVDVWLSVLRLLLCGHQYVPVAMMGDRGGEPPFPDSGPGAAGAAPKAAYARLTPREMQILPLIARGMQNKTIAGELGLSEHTIKLHTHNIYSKLKVSNRTGAANWYLSQVEGTGGQRAHVD